MNSRNLKFSSLSTNYKWPLILWADVFDKVPEIREQLKKLIFSIKNADMRVFV